MTPIVQMHGIKKTYKLGDSHIHALRGIDLEVQEGTFASVIGISGCGKTTLLNIIGCIDSQDEGGGDILIGGEDVSCMTDNDLSEFRGANIGFIFQHFNLIPVFSVEENVSYPLMLQQNTRYHISKNKIEERVDEVLEKVGLLDLKKQKPKKLSGGQRQRVAIARALIHYPKLVIADEPTANLDRETSQNIINLMLELQKEYNTTFIFATHDFRYLDFLDVIYEIEDGLITGTKSKQDIIGRS